MAALKTHLKESVLVAQFNRERATNPLNRELEQGIVQICQQAENDPGVRALVLTGGEGRSFCVGDDFDEANQLTTRADVEGLIDRVIALYVAILQVTKPTVAALDGYAIGGGFQMALACDWRIGTAGTKAISWELKHGMGCPLGAYMLEKVFGRAAMTAIIYGCDSLPIDWAVENKFLNEIADTKDLVEKGIARAKILGAYPDITYRRTKESVNRSFITGLRDIAPSAKEIHVAGFLSKSAEPHFRRVLRRRGA